MARQPDNQTTDNQQRLQQNLIFDLLNFILNNIENIASGAFLSEIQPSNCKKPLCEMTLAILIIMPNTVLEQCFSFLCVLPHTGIRVDCFVEVHCGHENNYADKMLSAIHLNIQDRILMTMDIGFSSVQFSVLEYYTAHIDHVCTCTAIS